MKIVNRITVMNRVTIMTFMILSLETRICNFIIKVFDSLKVPLLKFFHNLIFVSFCFCECRYFVHINCHYFFDGMLELVVTAGRRISAIKLFIAFIFSFEIHKGLP